jgi:hypothetical protein
MDTIALKIARKILAQCEIEDIKKENVDYILIHEQDLIPLLSANHKVFVFYYEPNSVKMHKLWEDILITLGFSPDPEKLGLYQGDYFCALPLGWRS